jgi:chaperonin GroEL
MQRLPKKVFGPEEGQEKMKKGIATFSKAVKETLGPDGRFVVVDDPGHILGGFKVTKDGQDIAKSIVLEDPVENIGATMLKEAAALTHNLAGDGTTTAVVLSEALINAFDEAKIEIGISKIDIIRKIVEFGGKMVGSIDDLSTKISELPSNIKNDYIRKIATISGNNDESIGEIVSDIFSKTENVTIEDSLTSKTHSEYINGVILDKGFVSPHLITNERSRACELENPLILFCDMEIFELDSILEIVKEAVQNNQPLLVIGNFKPNAANSFVYNVINSKGQFSGCLTTTPSHGFRSKEIMKDLVDIFGGVYYSDVSGDNSQVLSPRGLGSANKVVVYENKTIIYPTDEQFKRIDEKLESLKDIKAGDQTDESIDDRIKTISGSIGIIHVGSDSKVENKEKKDRMDDAVRAVTSAIEEGVIPGGGKSIITAYQKVYDDLFKQEGESSEIESIALEILQKVSVTPLNQMLLNAGFLPKDIQDIIVKVSNSEQNEGYNIKTRQFVDLLESGVIDPAKVLKTALSSALSVSSTILNTSCVVSSNIIH